MPLFYFLQWGQIRRWSPTTPSSWGSVCGLTWSRLAAFHCSRSALQRGISVSSSHIHQHISHVHYAVYQWLWLMDTECVHVPVYVCLGHVHTYVCLLDARFTIFFPLSFHICFFFLLFVPHCYFCKSSALHFQCRWFKIQLNAFMWNDSLYARLDNSFSMSPE